MNESDLLERYALALDLVPEPDLAGELFMESPDTASLLRRANRWRKRNGLPARFMPVALRPLSPIEAEYALHLARRGRRRRWLIRGALVLSTLLLLAISPLLLRSDVPAGAIASDPVFSAAPIGHLTHPSGYRLAVYKVESDPGSVTVWWSAAGYRPEKMLDKLTPQLLLDSATADWLAPTHQETSKRLGRLLVRSRFETFVTVEQEALLSFAKQRPDEPGWLLRVPLVQKAVDPSARVLPLNQTVSRGPITIQLQSLTLGQNYARIRYSSSTTVGRSPALYAIQAGSNTLGRKGPVVVSGPRSPGEMPALEATFEALPQQIDQLTLLFTPVFVNLPPRTYQLPRDPAIELYTRHAQVATAVLVVEMETWGATATATFDGEGGQRFPAEVSFQIEGNPPKNRVMVRAEQLPADLTLTSLTLTNLRQAYELRIPVVLSPEDAKGPGD